MPSFNTSNRKRESTSCGNFSDLSFAIGCVATWFISSRFDGADVWDGDLFGRTADRRCHRQHVQKRTVCYPAVLCDSWYARCADHHTIFFDSAASRDFTSKFSDVLFTKPIRKREYLLGRFLAACVVSMLPIVGISIGIIVAGWLPGRDPERWCPVHWQAHGNVHSYVRIAQHGSCGSNRLCYRILDPQYVVLVLSSIRSVGWLQHCG